MFRGSKNNGVIAVAIIVIFALISSSEARKITLDRDSDKTREFIDIDCYYTEDYDDFWVWGCVAEPANERPAGSTGFWSACSKQCQIIYNTGILDKPKTIVIEGFVQGSSEIQVSGVMSLVNTTEWEPIDTIPASADWFSFPVDLAEFPDLYIFNINPIPGADGFILIDKVIIDLGDEIPDPTTLGPLPTTPAPEDVGLIPLDKENDHPKYWQQIQCHYAGHYDDFGQAWGCPTDLGNHVSDVEPNVGYWTSCQRQSCEMLYYGSIIDAPLSVRLHTFIKGSAKIYIIGKRSPYDDLVDDTYLYTITVGGGNNQGYCNKIEDLDLTAFPDIYAVSVKLVSAADGFALVDRLSAQLKTDVEDGYESSIVGDVLCNILLGPDPTPTSGPEPTTVVQVPSEKPSERPDTDAGIYHRSDANLVLFVLACLCVKYFV